MMYDLKLKPCFASGIGECSKSSVILVTTTIKLHGRDALFHGLLAYSFAYQCCCSDIATVGGLFP